MSSILTNTGAMVALQTLKNTNTNLTKVQTEIATGKSVASAKDNAAVWAISKVMETDQSGFKVIRDQLNVAQSTVAVGLAGAEQVTDLLKEMKDLAAGAANDTADFAKVQTDIEAKQTQIEAIVNASQFNGINLLKANIGTSTPDAGGGAATPNQVFKVLSSLDRANGQADTTPVFIEVAGQAFDTDVIDARDANGDITGTPKVTKIESVESAKTAIGDIEKLIDTAIKGAATLGSAAKRISDQSAFVGKLSDALKSGIGALVDADMEETSAKMQALQVQQQLGIQALSIANQAPQSVLGLFR